MAETDELLKLWRAEVWQLAGSRNLDVPTLNDHIPGFLKELALALRAAAHGEGVTRFAARTPAEHGFQRVVDGFEIDEVVAEYNLLRRSIHDLADQKGIALQGKAFRILNDALDAAIRTAVQAYSAQKAYEVQKRREEYLAFVVHDLRTPLNAITLATKILETTSATGANTANADKLFKTLHRNIQNLTNLVKKVMDENANIQTETGVKLERRYLDLWPLVEALIYDLNPISGTGSTKIINNIPDDLVVYADASLLRRIYQNLIANALAYTPYGQIVLSARIDAGGNAIECRVSDNGSGIPTELIDKVFDKFETDPNRSNSGTGLGLSICKTFVEAHGGTIAVESGMGSGSEFVFMLPLKD
ncbi:MAG TPA: HAMP domain-containing sensor histidine kinase [Burkholderiaceae bacterium]|nr:HAMP domain-containing sensor histidine kinase [Burkholderiaceae bacterium]